ncbi:MAG: murein L,D-transpeptidase [Sphingomonadales bacterium]|nr:murein L,D-transpeptidase [Sphingomonadales bacterium]
MQRTWLTGLLILGLAACRFSVQTDDDDKAGKDGPRRSAAAVRPSATPAPDAMAAVDPTPGATPDPARVDDRPRPTMQLQVVLDRLGFTPGVVDGKPGLSTRNALAGFQEAHGLTVTGEPDAATTQALRPWATIPATRVVTIAADFAAGPFVATPKASEDQARLPVLDYQSLDEKLAERFHTTPATVLALNPDVAARPATTAGDAVPAHFRAGDKVRVPNVGADRIDAGAVSDPKWRATLATLGVGTDQPKVMRIVVSKSKGTLKAYDADGRLVAVYTATMGSQHDPLPLGEWKVVGVSHNPDFAFDPRLLWDVPDSDGKQHLPPGPNGPVGVAWIKLDKPHYGIHGTPEPESIGRAQSHGCVRLTNWDVARLAQMVHVGTRVSFVS